MSVLYFTRLLTFATACKNVKNGQKSKKIQHIVLAKQTEGEYTFPCLRDVELKEGTRPPFRPIPIAGQEEDFPGMTGVYCKPGRMFFLLMLAGCIFFAAGCGAEEPCRLLGDWAFDYEPAETVLTVREDGSAFWNGEAFTWEDDGTFLLLSKEEGEVLPLRYLAEEDKVRVFLTGTYTRTAKDKDEEIFGAWKKDGSYGSAFVFEKDMRFMEDGTFVGTFELDEEAGTFTLKYQPDIFEDTTCYFIREGDRMTVEYPWTVVKVQEEKAAE